MCTRCDLDRAEFDLDETMFAIIDRRSRGLESPYLQLRKAELVDEIERLRSLSLPAEDSQP